MAAAQPAFVPPAGVAGQAVYFARGFSAVTRLRARRGPLPVHRHGGNGRVRHPAAPQPTAATAAPAVSSPPPSPPPPVPDAGAEWITGARGLQVYVRKWLPAGGDRVPAAVILAHHGGFGHGGLLAGLAGWLTRPDAPVPLAVVTLDAMSHGRSERLDGRFGYYESMDDLTANVRRVADAVVRREWPTAPLFVLAESVGATVLLSMAVERPSAATVAVGGDRARTHGWAGEDVRGMVLLGPAVQLRREFLPPPPVVAVLRAAARLFPYLSLPGGEDDLAGGASWDAAFGDPAAAAAVAADPLVSNVQPRLRTMVGMLAAFEALWGALERVDVPLLVLHGDEDGRVELDKSEALVRRAAAADKRLDVLPGARHMLLLDRPEVTRDVMARIEAWVGERV